MPENSQIISLVVVIILIVAIIFWLYVTIRSIRLSKRIGNYVMANYNFENISLYDRIASFVNKIIDNCVKKMKLIKVDKVLYRQQDSGVDVLPQLRFLVIKISSSLILVVIYLFLSIFKLTSFSVFATILVLLIGYCIPVIISCIKRNIIKKQIESDLLKAISLMNNSFQSGKSIIQTIQTVSKELDGPLADEFGKMYQDMLHGLSFQTAFNRFDDRVNIEEIKYITSALLILSKTGGNIMEVFASIERSFYTRRKLDMELKATIASSKLVFQLLVFLPVFLWGVIGLWNPTYFSIFFESTIGITLFSIILCIYLIYIVVIRNIMKVEKY